MSDQGSRIQDSPPAAASLPHRRKNGRGIGENVIVDPKCNSLPDVRWEFLRKTGGTGLALEGAHRMTSVLFVSHDGNLRAAAARALARRGLAVTQASHGGHALLACVERGSFDSLVIEHDMPEGPGSAIAERLRRHCPDLHVVRMCDEGTVERGEGIAVVRPFTADDLIDAVQARRRTITL